MRRLKRRGWLLLATVLLGTALGAPLGAIASHNFNDVPPGTFHEDISAITAAGITTGCAPNLYCPKDFVTREQMAAFLNRLGALGPGKTPVVNATRLDGLNSTAFLRAQDIVTHDLGPWVELGDNANITVLHYNPFTRVRASSSATAVVMLHVKAPSSFGSRTYGVKSVEICYGDEFGTILDTSVVRGRRGDGDTLILDLTNRSMTSSECYTLTDSTPNVASGGIIVMLAITITTGTSAVLYDVTTTWTPTTTP